MPARARGPGELTTPVGTRGEAPRLIVMGLGPGAPELVPPDVHAAVSSAPARLRTRRHPAARDLAGVPSFDELYDRAGTFDEVYAGIVEALVADTAAAAAEGRKLVYLVPGSPLVAERTVELLRADDRVELEVHPAPSFLDLAWARLGLDPLATGVKLADAAAFRQAAAGSTGPFLVAQCWSPSLLSEVKLAIGEEADRDLPPVTVLRHLGLPDELVREVPWEELDRAVEADHLTSLFVPEVRSPVAREVVALEELGRTLRERCPWDREQTHRSLRRHVVEEAYEVVDAIDELDLAERRSGPAEAAAVAHLEEELGDLLFQVVIHARLAAEEGRFTLADVAEGVRTKLVARHPHVFGDVAAESADQVAANWERLKATEKERRSAVDGIPWQFPALVLAVELQRKAERAGLTPAPGDDPGTGDPDAEAPEREVGDRLFDLCAWARSVGVEPELALRQAARRFDRRVRAAEDAARGLPEAPRRPL